ncbi:MAG: hypothetical protein R8L53_10005 [Mariprofundales bacterium]
MLFGFSLVVSAGIGSAGPIGFNSALPLSEGVGIVRSQVMMVRKTGDSTSMNRKATATIIPLVMAYGVSPQLALFGVLPYVKKRLDITVGGMRINRQSIGIGDGKLFARYTIYQSDQHGDTLRIAPFAGLKVPSGQYQQSDSVGVLARPLQVGSGSWDPFAGLAVTRQTLAWEFDGAISYRYNSQASGFTFGDEARLDTSFQYRIIPSTLANSGMPAFVYAVLESGVIWNGKNNIAGVSDGNSGGVIWNIAPGLQYVTRRFVLETVLQIPTVQRPNGTALTTDWVWTAGVRWNF